MDRLTEARVPVYRPRALTKYPIKPGAVSQADWDARKRRKEFNEMTRAVVFGVLLFPIFYFSLVTVLLLGH